MRRGQGMGSKVHSKFQGIPVASRICPSRQRRVFRLHQMRHLLIYHSQHPKKNRSMAAAPFCQMPPRNFPRRNWHLQVAERASGTKARKIIPPLFQFRLCLSLSLSPLSGAAVPALPHTHLLANGIALYSRKFVRGDSFVRRARPDPTWRRRRRTSARGELWPGAEGRNPRGEVAAL